MSTYLLLFDSIPSEDLIEKSRDLPMWEQGQCGEYFVKVSVYSLQAGRPRVRFPMVPFDFFH